MKTKTTPHKSNTKGKLPHLVPCWQHGREEWGTAAETFHKRLSLPLDPRQGDVLYKGTCIVMLNMSYFVNNFILCFFST